MMVLAIILGFALLVLLAEHLFKVYFLSVCKKTQMLVSLRNQGKITEKEAMDAAIFGFYSKALKGKLKGEK